MILGNVDLADYSSVPLQLIGGLTMRKVTADDDWTFDALPVGRYGIGEAAIEGTCSAVYTMPHSQMGASPGGHFRNTGGTGPIWENQVMTYMLSRDGFCMIIARFFGGDPNGAGTVPLFLALPYEVEKFEGIIGMELCGHAKSFWDKGTGQVSSLDYCRTHVGNTLIEFVRGDDDTGQELLKNGDMDDNGDYLSNIIARYGAFQ